MAACAAATHTLDIGATTTRGHSGGCFIMYRAVACAMMPMIKKILNQFSEEM